MAHRYRNSIFTGGHVAVQPAEEGLSMYLAEVVSMWEEEKSKEKFFHARWYYLIIISFLFFNLILWFSYFQMVRSV